MNSYLKRRLQIDKRMCVCLILNLEISSTIKDLELILIRYISDTSIIHIKSHGRYQLICSSITDNLLASNSSLSKCNLSSGYVIHPSEIQLSKLTVIDWWPTQLLLQSLLISENHGVDQRISKEKKEHNREDCRVTR